MNQNSDSESSSSFCHEDEDSVSHYSDWEDDENGASAKCIFCDVVENSVTSLLAHMNTEHKFDLVTVCRREHLDTYGRIKLINYLRKTADPTDAVLSDSNLLSEKVLSDDVYLKPTLQDDALLFDFDSDDEFDEESDEQAATVNYQKQYNELLEKFQFLSRQHSELKTMVHDRFLGDDQLTPPPSPAKACPIQSPDAPQELDYYFDSYSHLDIHEQMLKDKVRTDAYRDFIYLNKHLIQDKVVLDVGCGTGILSMFCAKSGAKRVYAVDNSRMIDQAREIARLNGLLADSPSDTNKIVFIQGKMEEVELPEKVDYIVSEWMGYCLLFEAMLDSVLVARDCWMKPNGSMIPSHASMHIAAISDEEWFSDRMDYWNDVYGFNMSSMKRFFDKTIIVDFFGKDCLASNSIELRRFDCNQCTVQDLDFHQEFILDISKDTDLHGLCCWFDIDFSIPGATTCQPVSFSTSPDRTPTHWKQCLFAFKDGPISVQTSDNLKCWLTCRKNPENPRNLDVLLSYQHQRGSDVLIPERIEIFQLH